MKNNIVEGKPFTFKSNGEHLAKVLSYKGYIPDTSSNNYKIVCPFHQDINPSLIVNLEDGSWFCFGCGLSGDAVKFVELLYPKLNELQAFIRFLKILKSDKVSKIDFSNRHSKPKKENKELYNIAWDYYHGLSKIDWSKDKSDDVLKAKDYMIKRGFTSKVLNECKAKITYNDSYPIIFPMIDNGKFKGWVCRTTNKDIEAKRKYLYNEGFSRASTLVGEYQNEEIIFVVEGYMDRLKFIQYGVYNVVAILGWKMSQGQEEELRKSNVKIIISALDNDECGRKGTKYLKSIFQNVYRFKYLKGLKDVGESTQTQFAKMYKETMKSINAKSKSTVVGITNVEK